MQAPPLTKIEWKWVGLETCFPWSQSNFNFKTPQIEGPKLRGIRSSGGNRQMSGANTIIYANRASQHLVFQPGNTRLQMVNVTDGRYLAGTHDLQLANYSLQPIGQMQPAACPVLMCHGTTAVLIHSIQPLAVSTLQQHGWVVATKSVRSTKSNHLLSVLSQRVFADSRSRASRWGDCWGLTCSQKGRLLWPILSTSAMFTGGAVPYIHQSSPSLSQKREQHHGKCEI